MALQCWLLPVQKGGSGVSTTLVTIIHPHQRTCIGLGWPCATIADFDSRAIHVHLVLEYLTNAQKRWMARQALEAAN